MDSKLYRLQNVYNLKTSRYQASGVLAVKQVYPLYSVYYQKK